MSTAIIPPYSGTAIGNLQTVGDLIVAVRTLGPDPPLGVLPPPVVDTAVPTTGGTLAFTTWFLVVTQLNPWGESLPTNEQ